MKNLSINIINYELQEVFNKNYSNIIRDLRICFTTNIIINNKLQFTCAFTYFDCKFFYFSLKEEFITNFYKVGKYLNYNIYGLKYKSINLFYKDNTIKVDTI